jgi:excinuclease UvrABC helicase subunit UvrB
VIARVFRSYTAQIEVPDVFLHDGTLDLDAIGQRFVSSLPVTLRDAIIGVAFVQDTDEAVPCTMFITTRVHNQTDALLLFFKAHFTAAQAEWQKSIDDIPF